jgi:hypothetical protein
MAKWLGVYEGTDDGQRPAGAVAISMVDIRPGYVRIIFDDIERVSKKPVSWRHGMFVTFANLPARKVKLLGFSQKQLAGLGATVLGMLKAQRSPKKSPRRNARRAQPAAAADSGGSAAVAAEPQAVRRVLNKVVNRKEPGCLLPAQGGQVFVSSFTRCLSR